MSTRAFLDLHSSCQLPTPIHAVLGVEHSLQARDLLLRLAPRLQSVPSQAATALSSNMISRLVAKSNKAAVKPFMRTLWTPFLVAIKNYTDSKHCRLRFSKHLL